ncbi:MAG TPA: CshA/CshB family fibrillar adhesin-related protein [Prolixibacteraceae bacterium]|nr:CshA/CshB family fibrillar adhesin-related protein [Prolixibacteraceae bacterium]HPL44643.1 CshA/CshB family fibrillar adhesin-related protein [Prolixibacteraceae bacterium]
MNKLLFAVMLGFVFLGAGAQKWNPYAVRAAVSPAPMLPHEFGGNGELTFVLGNSGNEVMKRVADQEMTLMITLSYGVPADEDPLASVGGPWAGKFRWSYDPSLGTYMAVQKEDIPAASEGLVSIRYKVTGNSRSSAPANGFNVNLQQPPYTNGVNLTHDDDVSAYTFVRAYDYGDAPASYGEAVHEIDVFKDPGSGNYLNYVYLGRSVDAEPSGFHTSGADGDDLNGSDDEDGVVFPELIRGDTVTLPVVVTIHEGGYGVLNTWIDWNGDGDFTDPGEKIAGPVDFFESGTKTLTLIVPTEAEISKPVYARFRLGENKGSPAGSHEWGEVEDYLLTIREKETDQESKIDPVLPSGVPVKFQDYDYITPAIYAAGSVVFKSMADNRQEKTKTITDKFSVTP